MIIVHLHDVWKLWYFVICGIRYPCPTQYFRLQLVNPSSFVSQNNSEFNSGASWWNNGGGAFSLHWWVSNDWRKWSCKNSAISAAVCFSCVILAIWIWESELLLCLRWQHWSLTALHSVCPKYCCRLWRTVRHHFYYRDARCKTVKGLCW